MQNIHKREFDLTKDQLAHELALLKLSTSVDAQTKMPEIFDQYLVFLREAKDTIDDKTRYESETLD